MNVNGPQGQPNPAHYAALQQQQHQQSQQQHANQQQYGGPANNHQLQQMYMAQQANKFGAQQHPNASMYQQQQQQMMQQQGFNPAGVNPSALINGRGGMPMNMGGMGGGMGGMSHQQMQQLQNMSRVNPAMLANASGGMGGINPSQLLNQQHMGMNGNPGMGMSGNMGGGMGGMTMNGGMNMGGINPAALTASNSGSGVPTSSSPPIPSGSAAPQTPNLSAAQPASNPGNPSHSQHPHQLNMPNLGLSATQMQQLNAMPQQERNKVLQRLMLQNMHQQGQQAQNANQMGNMGMGGMGDGSNTMMNFSMSGNQGGSGFNPQMAQMNQMNQMHLQQQQQQQRPGSSAGHPHPGMNNMNMGASGMAMPTLGNVMMPPPSSIPPRPPTASGQGPRPTPSPRPGTGGGFPQQQGQQQHQQPQQLPQPGTGTAPNSRPGTAGASPSRGMAPPPPRTQTPSRMHQQQQQGGRHTPGPGSTPTSAGPSGMSMAQQQQSSPSRGTTNLPTPIPIQPRPPMMNMGGQMQMNNMGMARGAGSPAPRPGTGQGQRVPSRPGTVAPEFSGQPNGGNSQPMQQQQQQGQTAGYQAIAPAPSTPTSASSMDGKNVRKVSGTPGPGTPASGQFPPSQIPQQQQAPQLQRSVSIPPNTASISAGVPNPGPRPSSTASAPGGGGASTGLAGMGIVGNVGMGMRAMGGMPNVTAMGGGGGMNAAAMGISGMGTMGNMGPIGGMNNMNQMGMMNGMGPPPFPRSQSQGPQPTDSSMAAQPGMQRQMSTDATGMGVPPRVSVPAVNGLSVNTNLANSVPNPIMATPTMSSPMNIPTLPSLEVPTPQDSRQGSQQPPAKMNGVSATNGLGANVSTGSTANGGTKIINQYPPLPAGLKFNPIVTNITPVPFLESAKLIPPLSSEEIGHVQEWMKVDKAYEVTYKKMKEDMTEEVRENVVKGRAWWEKDPRATVDEMRGMAGSRRRPGEKLTLTGLKTGKDDRRPKKAGKREGFKLPRSIDPDDATRREQLVPIRLEFDVEHQKMRDTFVWNLNDPIITPEIFAQSIVDDYALAPSYHATITKTIQDQLSDYKAHSNTFGEDGLLNSPVEDLIENGKLDDEEAVWWEAWRKQVRSEVGYKQIGGEEGRSRKRRKVVKDEAIETPEILKHSISAASTDAPMSVDDFEEDESKMNEELRILIKLDIIVGPAKLEDQFEWDLENEDPSPEQFAEIYAKELGLGGEFKTAIAHSIREQVQTYQKSLFLVGHPSDGTMLQDDDLRMSLLPSLSTGARSMDQVVAFTPVFISLSDSEIERNEREREKELNRRRRKTTRGRRGVILPDREPPKTFRTPAIGFPEVDAATLNLVAAAAVPTRRAAAAAASLTIANMVASENGTVVIPQTAQAPLTPQVSTPVAPAKDKKPKGLFKPPSYPSTVLRPRAHVRAPTDSTAADPSTLPPPLEDDMPLPTSNSNIENRGARVVLSAKRVKELEREAKEKEYVDGQHANIINGVWHCSNCGCPENIAIGRRKGPLGDKSQCGLCGKYWHRHRRPRPVVYNSDPEFHLNLKREEEQSKINSNRKKRPHAANTEAPPSKAPTVEPETPAKPKSEVWTEAPKASPKEERAVSPISTASSASEAPLAAQRIKPNGTTKPAPPEPSTPPQPTPPVAAPPVTTPQTPGAAPASSAAPAGQGARPPAPDWLKLAVQEMQNKYPDDQFEVILRRMNHQPNPEWRIRCLDCPGKLYTPGPGETLTNYEVHLKNRQHRAKVNARVNNTNTTTTDS